MTESPSPSESAIPADPNAWLPPDWSQFIPDLVITAVVGVLVGLALWLVQSSAAKRASRQLAESMWAHTRPAIVNAVSEPITRDLAPIGYWQPDVGRLIAAAKSIDVVAISAALPENREIRALAHIVRETPTLRRAARDLDLAFQTELDAQLPPPSGAISSAAQTVHAADLLGIESPNLGIYERNPVVRDHAALVAEAESVRRSSARYVSVLNQIEASYEELRGLLLLTD